MLDSKGTWAIVEIFGHTRFAGRLTEVELAGKRMVQVDCPTVVARWRGEVPAWTKVINPDSVFSVTPCSEEQALAEAVRLGYVPFSVDFDSRQPSLPAPAPEDFDDDEDFDDPIDVEPLDEDDRLVVDGVDQLPDLDPEQPF